MDELTERQAEILRLVRELTEVSGYPPTRAEIAERMGFRSVNAAEQHLRALEKKGAIDIESGASRGIRVRDTRPSGRLGRLLELPVVGRVAAGSPILAEEHLQGRYSLQVVDIYQHPQQTREEQIIAAPTLIKRLPAPLRRLIGDMSDEQRVLVGLDIRPQQSGRVNG